MFNTSTIFHKVLLRAIAKHSRSTGAVIFPESVLLELCTTLVEDQSGRFSIWEICPKAAGLHAFETKGKGTFGLPEFHSIVGLIQG